MAYRVRNALEINGERVIGTSLDEQAYSRLNLLLRGADGTPI
jgi:hypothetical protein